MLEYWLIFRLLYVCIGNISNSGLIGRVDVPYLHISSSLTVNAMSGPRCGVEE
jgi:hypothetical protein